MAEKTSECSFVDQKFCPPSCTSSVTKLRWNALIKAPSSFTTRRTSEMQRLFWQLFLCSFESVLFQFGKTVALVDREASFDNHHTHTCLLCTLPQHT
eukprot:m.40414 g.40414  ORF g.40414 m.40414 type:complete len:97 (-) comp10438_c0_seq1:153-443(-)